MTNREGLDGSAELLDSNWLERDLHQGSEEVPLYGQDPRATTTLAERELWLEPEPLPNGEVVVPAFALGMLPSSIRDFVNDIGHRMQVPLDMPAVATICALGGAAGRRVKVQPKERDSGWKKTPNVWGGIVAPPGSMKTPVFSACLAPLQDIEAALQQETLQEVECDEEGEAPKVPRLIVNDATPEVLLELMTANPHGLLQVRDELTGMFEMQEKKGREGERQFYLEGWNGDSRYTSDRISRGTTSAICCISVFGGIQPDKLATYLNKWYVNGSGNDGFMERFQVLVSPDFSPDWVYVDQAPDKLAEGKVRKIFDEIVSIDPEEGLVFKFASNGAQDFFIGWLSQLERRLRHGNLHPVLCSHLSKYRSLMPSLACLFALSDLACSGVERFRNVEGSPMIPMEHARMAAEWCAYLEAHAHRIYSSIITPGLQPANILARHMLNRKLAIGQSFTVRDIKQKGWRGLGGDSNIESALSVLLIKRWIVQLPDRWSPAGGRPTARYEINPKVMQRFTTVN
ncbi:MAG: YfjI family protein [Bryobacteraceae bacterium]